MINFSFRLFIIFNNVSKINIQTSKYIYSNFVSFFTFQSFPFLFGSFGVNWNFTIRTLENWWNRWTFCMISHTHIIWLSLFVSSCGQWEFWSDLRFYLFNSIPQRYKDERRYISCLLKTVDLFIDFCKMLCKFLHLYFICGQ